MTRDRDAVHLWRAPLLLGALSAAGLVAALVSDDAGDVIAWITLSIPVLAAVWYWGRPRPRA